MQQGLTGGPGLAAGTLGLHLYFPASSINRISDSMPSEKFFR
jgi:hypothetical protein